MRRSLALAVIGSIVVVSSAAAAAPSRPGLRSFQSCTALNSYLQTQALRRLGASDLGAGSVAPVARRDAGPVAAVGPGSPPAPEIAFSATNVQEAGVDEPDVVKTNGRVLFAIAGGSVRAVGVDAAPKHLGSLTLPGLAPESLLLIGERLLVISRATLEPSRTVSGGSVRVGAPEFIEAGPAATVVSEVDVRDPGAMRVVATLRLEGDLLAARQTATTVRIVLRAPFDVLIPGPLPPPQSGIAGGISVAPAAPAERTRAAIKRTQVRDWLPHYRLKRNGQRVRRGVIAGCAKVAAPVRFGGFGTVTVVTLDAAQGLRMVDADTVVSGGDVVYASPTSLYVATADWYDVGVWQRRAAPPSGSTRIHRFDTADPGRTTYRASGGVPGFVPGQWAMSEQAGLLRVASTQEPTWWQGAEARRSESHVTVLGEQGGRLLRVGSVAGIGRGERITGVRFIGDIGYVVTFRQIDPLHVVDLSDPANPRVRGELKIPGFSAYLHPVSEGLLLGIGQDADDTGRVLGTQFSLFDVANLAAPARIASLRLSEGGFSEAEWDHKAFTYWAPTGLALVPFVDDTVVGGNGERGPDAKAVGIRVSGRTLSEVARIVHPAVAREGGAQSSAPIRRSVVVGSAVYTVSDDGVHASDLATLAPGTWLPFAAAR